MKNCFTKLTVAMLTVAGLTWCSSARAGFVFSADNLLQFSNREVEVDGGGTPGVLQIGDRLTGILVANQLTANGVAQTPPTPEITGVFDMTVEFLMKSDGTLVSNADIADGSVSGKLFALFRPTNVLDDGTAGDGLLSGKGYGKGAGVALFEGGPADVLATLNDAGKTTADAFDAASDGTFQGSFGFGGVATDGSGAFDAPADFGAAGNGYWVSTVDFVVRGGHSVSIVQTDFYYGLTGLAGPLVTTAPMTPGLNANLSSDAFAPGTLIVDNAIPPPVGAGTGATLFDLTGKGTTFASAVNGALSDEDKAKFPIFSNDPAQLHPNPEPSSVVLFALGALCGIPYLRRRRKNRVA